MPAPQIGPDLRGAIGACVVCLTMWIKAVILPYLALGFVPARRPVARRAVPRMIQTDIDVGYAREIPVRRARRARVVARPRLPLRV